MKKQISEIEKALNTALYNVAWLRNGLSNTGKVELANLVNEIGININNEINSLENVLAELNRIEKE